MDGEVRHCRTDDGVRIAYRVSGSGPVVVRCPWFVESFSLPDEQVAEFWGPIAAGRTVVGFDMRGTGLSDRDVEDFSHAALILDLEAVVRAARLERFDLVGQQGSGPTAISFAVRHPELVERLVLMATFARVSDVLPRPTIDAFSQLARSNWPLAAQALSDARGRQRHGEYNARGAEVYLGSATGEVAARFLLANAETDVTSELPAIRSETLVLQMQDDEFLPLSVANALTDAIPGARLVVCAFPAEREEDSLAYAMDAFLAPRPVQKKPARGAFHTVLFTDLVGHTEMMRRLGDDRGRDVLREHERITRDLLRANGGTEVKTMGDGFMASFASVAAAMDCAIELQRALAAHEGEPLQVRVGLNAGEPIVEDGNLFGSTVIMASRIAARAGAGEILIPEPLRHLLTGKSYVYADRGETILKGFEDAVRLYEVRWQE